ncbi:hypothetical protein D3C72_2290610 [compost metagenome]
MLLEALAHQVGLRVDALQVGADGTRFAHHAAVVQLQHRHAAEGIPGQESLAAVFQLAQVDQLRFNADALLGHEHRHPAGIGRARARIQFHVSDAFLA